MDLIKHIICIHDILKTYIKYSIIIINSFYLDIKVQYIPTFSFQLIRSSPLWSLSRGILPFSFAVVYKVAFVGVYKHQLPYTFMSTDFSFLQSFLQSSSKRRHWGRGISMYPLLHYVAHLIPYPVSSPLLAMPLQQFVFKAFCGLIPNGIARALSLLTFMQLVNETTFFT